MPTPNMVMCSFGLVLGGMAVRERCAIGSSVIGEEVVHIHNILIYYTVSGVATT
jgi:hypothetical protein